jgi:hypothetical protein
MKTLNTIILLVISATALAQTGNHLTAAQILDSSITFCGGEKRIADIRSASINYLLIQPDGSSAIVTEKRNTGQRYVQSVLSMEHVPQTTFFNSNRITRVKGSSIIQIKDIEAVEEIKLKTYNQIQYGYKALGYGLTRLPDKKFQNFDCYVVNAKAENGYTTMNFFDKTNFRLLMVAYPNGNKSLMIEYIFKDNVLFNSYIINTFVDSGEKQALKLQQIDLNITISDLWFNCPYKDKVYIPSHIMTGKFESTSGVKTVFTRTKDFQDYYDDQGKVILRRSLKWANDDTYGLMDEKVTRDNAASAGAGILVRIISWDDNGYVCHWITGKNTDTQDYKTN